MILLLLPTLIIAATRALQPTPPPTNEWHTPVPGPIGPGLPAKPNEPPTHPPDYPKIVPSVHRVYQRKPPASSSQPLLSGVIEPYVPPPPPDDSQPHSDSHRQRTSSNDFKIPSFLPVPGRRTEPQPGGHRTEPQSGQRPPSHLYQQTPSIGGDNRPHDDHTSNAHSDRWPDTPQSPPPTDRQQNYRQDAHQNASGPSGQPHYAQQHQYGPSGQPHYGQGQPYGPSGQPHYGTQQQQHQYGNPGQPHYGQQQQYGPSGQPHYGQGQPHYGQEHQYGPSGQPHYGQQQQPSYSASGQPHYGTQQQQQQQPYGPSGQPHYAQQYGPSTQPHYGQPQQYGAHQHQEDHQTQPHYGQQQQDGPSRQPHYGTQQQYGLSPLQQQAQQYGGGPHLSNGRQTPGGGAIQSPYPSSLDTESTAHSSRAEHDRYGRPSSPSDWRETPAAVAQSPTTMTGEWGRPTGRNNHDNARNDHRTDSVWADNDFAPYDGRERPEPSSRSRSDQSIYSTDTAYRPSPQHSEIQQSPSTSIYQSPSWGGSSQSSSGPRHSLGRQSSSSVVRAQDPAAADSFWSELARPSNDRGPPNFTAQDDLHRSSSRPSEYRFRAHPPNGPPSPPGRPEMISERNRPRQYAAVPSGISRSSTSSRNGGGGGSRSGGRHLVSDFDAILYR